MALVSPGVEVTVTDDSAYPASGQGTVPLIFLATAQDKLVPGSTSTVAAGTLKANANKPYLLTSQSDALNFLGSPIFQEDNGTVLQGDELNEWGLHGLYSVLGVTNQAWAVRADIDLQELEPTQVEPRDFANPGTNWFNIDTTVWGLKTFDTTTNRWLAQDVLAYTGADITLDTTFGGSPVATIYAVALSTTVTTDIKFYQKTPGSANWVALDSTNLEFSFNTAPTTDKIWIRLDSAAQGMAIDVSQFTASTSTWTPRAIKAGVDLISVEGQLASQLALNSIGFVADNANTQGSIMLRDGGNGTITMPTSAALDISGATTGNIFTMIYSDGSVPVKQEVNITVNTGDYSEIVTGLTNLGFVVEDTTSDGTAIVIKRPDNRSFQYESTDLSIPLSLIYGADNYSLLNYEFTADEPTNVADELSLWFTDELYFDFLVNDGQQWQGLGLGSNDWVVSQTQPDFRADGLTPLATGDIWIDPVDGAEFEFYVYNATTFAWTLLDQADQSTTEGILFADMRQADASGVGYITESNNDTAKAALLASNHVDPDCPDPRLYPAGMIACNLRSSGNVVRNFTLDPFEAFDIDGAGQYFVGSNAYTLAKGVNDTVDTARWNTASSLNLDGSGNFGRKAQRQMIVEALAAATLSDEIRSEFMEFNLLTAPGYVELLDELVTLNVDRKETAFIITDVPARLAPTGTNINNWAKNANNAPSNGDVGRTTSYPYSAEYMGWCLGTNVDGAEVAIPGASVALRTYVYSDSVSYPWFPPAGTQRGIVTNAASVGYINAESEYEPVIYNQGQRDVMYENAINPIAMRPGRGLLVYGDKSLSPDASALDRVNVGRLVVYIRTEIAKISERYLFELNTTRTREEFAGALNAFLSNIVQLEGLYDYTVICDTSNNTPVRIDRNELWADIAIQPTKSINFVYVPIRIQNTE